MKVSGVQSKLCIMCNRVLPLSNFYANKDWVSQRYHDVWCKDCAQNYCKDIDSLKRYCFENNRQWKDSFWDTAAKKAQYVLSTDAKYLSPNTSQTKKDEIANAATARQFFTVMNFNSFYCYVDNLSDEHYAVGNDIQEKKDEPSGQPIYSQKWGGRFSQEEIDWLEDYYSQLENDFVLDNVNAKDYARKVAKASLNANLAEDKCRRGLISQKTYKEAQQIFDDLSKSANFAACRRKPGESSSLGSLGEIILRLEVNGELSENTFKFPPDDIDKIIADFDHTYQAIGAEAQL